jgi:hypothetical protein
MPITVDLEQSPFLRQLFEAACARVRIKNIIIVLQARFGESVPSDMEERLQKLSQEELDGMVGRIAIAPSIEEAIASRSARSLSNGPEHGT